MAWRARRPRSTTHAANDSQFSGPRTVQYRSSGDSITGGPRAVQYCSSGDSITGGPRASGPPGVQRLDQPMAGETPAVHHARGQRLAEQWTAGRPIPLVRRLDHRWTAGRPILLVWRLDHRWTAGLWPAGRPTTRSTHGGRDARGPPRTRPTTCRAVDRGPSNTARPATRSPVDRGPLARRASNDSINPWRARRPRSTTHAAPAGQQGGDAGRPTDRLNPPCGSRCARGSTRPRSSRGIGSPRRRRSR